MAYPNMVIGAPNGARAFPRIRDTKRACFLSQTVTLDAVKEYCITVSEMHLAGMDLQQVLYAWGSYPKLDNFVFTDISKGAVQAVHRALQHAVLRQRFARLDWFDIGLTVADLIRLHDLPVDVLCTFNVSAARMVDHDANNYGENWAQYFSWTVADWRRLGIDSIEYQEALKRQRVRSGSRTHLIAARTRWGPQEMPQLVAPWQGLRQ